MLPASSSAAAFILRARRKTISSLGGTRRPIGRPRPGAVFPGIPAVRAPRGAAASASTRPGHANRAVRRPPPLRARIETRSLPTGNAAHTRAAARATHAAAGSGTRPGCATPPRGAGWRPRCSRPARWCSAPPVRPPADSARPTVDPSAPTPTAPSRAAAAGQRARRQHGRRRGAGHPRAGRRRRRAAGPRRHRRARLAGRRRRHRAGARRAGPARPLLPGEHAQDADPADPAPRVLDPRRIVEGTVEDEAIEGSRVGPGARRPLLGPPAVPGAGDAVGQRRGQRPGPGRRRVDATLRGDERHRRGARRLRHRRRHAVRAGRRRPVVLALRPGADHAAAGRRPVRSPCCRPAPRRCPG